MRLNWFHALILCLLMAIGINSYLHSAPGKAMIFSAYGSSLIRPNETADIVNHLGLEISGPITEGSHEWNEVERAYYWVCQNVRYREDGNTAVELVGRRWVLYENEYFQSPAETLELRAGDCEDMAILLVSILRQAGAGANDVRVVLGTFNTDRAEYGHSWCEVAVGGRWRILDPSAGDIRIFGYEGIYREMAWFSDSGWGWL